MALVDSLLTAMVRANGDALVMHVGEKPIVVAGPRTMDLSSHGLNLGAMIGMLGQLLPLDAQSQLTEFGAVECALPSRGDNRFTVVAARGGDDIWIEIRRRRVKTAAAVEPVAAVDSPAAVEPPTAESPAAVESSAPVEPPATAPPAAVEPAVAVAPAELVESADAAEPAAPIEPVEVGETPEAVEPIEAAGLPVEATAVAEAAPSLPEAQGETTDTVFTPAAAPEAAASAAAEAERPREESSPEASDVGAATEVPEATDVAEGTSVDDSADLADESQPAAQDVAVTADVSVASTETRVESAAEEHDVPDLVALGVSTAARAPEAVALMAAASGGAPHSVPTTPMSTMDTAPHSDSTGGPTPPPATPPPPVHVEPRAADGAAPLTRTVRIEVPSRGVRPGSAERLLRLAGGQGASELFLLSQTRPSVRVDGDIHVLAEEPPIGAAELEAVIAEVTPDPWVDAVRRGDPAEWLIEIADVGRVRCASFRDRRGPGAIFRFTATQAVSAEHLALDEGARLLATEPDGLVVVAAPAGSGRSAIVAAFVDIINRHRGDYVITLEPQVRAAHDNRQALISQREVGTDPARVLAAGRAAVRENPDVLVVEDLATGELAALAIEAAGEGRLVIVSLEAESSAAAVQRLIELVPEDRQEALRRTMARSFRGAIAQLMVRKATGGRVAARELLPATHDTAHRLTGTPVGALAAALDEGRDLSSAPLQDALVGFVKAGVVDVREAYRKAPDPRRMIAALKAAGVDTAAVDRVV